MVEVINGQSIIRDNFQFSEGSNELNYSLINTLIDDFKLETAAYFWAIAYNRLPSDIHNLLESARTKTTVNHVLLSNGAKPVTALEAACYHYGNKINPIFFSGTESKEQITQLLQTPNLKIAHPEAYFLLTLLKMQLEGSLREESIDFNQMASHQFDESVLNNIQPTFVLILQKLREELKKEQLDRGMSDYIHPHFYQQQPAHILNYLINTLVNNQGTEEERALLNTPNSLQQLQNSLHIAVSMEDIDSGVDPKLIVHSNLFYLPSKRVLSTATSQSRPVETQFTTADGEEIQNPCFPIIGCMIGKLTEPSSYIVKGNGDVAPMMNDISDPITRDFFTSMQQAAAEISQENPLRFLMVDQATTTKFIEVLQVAKAPTPLQLQQSTDTPNAQLEPYVYNIHNWLSGLPTTVQALDSVKTQLKSRNEKLTALLNRIIERSKIVKTPYAIGEWLVRTYRGKARKQKDDALRELRAHMEVLVEPNVVITPFAIKKAADLRRRPELFNAFSTSKTKNFLQELLIESQNDFLKNSDSAALYVLWNRSYEFDSGSKQQSQTILTTLECLISALNGHHFISHYNEETKAITVYQMKWDTTTTGAITLTLQAQNGASLSLPVDLASLKTAFVQAVDANDLGMLFNKPQNANKREIFDNLVLQAKTNCAQKSHGIATEQSTTLELFKSRMSTTKMKKSPQFIFRRSH